MKVKTITIIILIVVITLAYIKCTDLCRMNLEEKKEKIIKEYLNSKEYQQVILNHNKALMQLFVEETIESYPFHKQLLTCQENNYSYDKGSHYIDKVPYVQCCRFTGTNETNEWLEECKLIEIPSEEKCYHINMIETFCVK